MPVDRNSICMLLNQLPLLPRVAKRNIHVRNIDSAVFSEPSPGYAIWRWGDLDQNDRLDATYLFNDSDGVGAFLSIVTGSDNSIKEIELWRGDAGRIERVPLAADLTEAKPGQVY